MRNHPLSLYLLRRLAAAVVVVIIAAAGREAQRRKYHEQRIGCHCYVLFHVFLFWFCFIRAAKIISIN